MVKFALPKNSKINPGKYHRNSDGSKNLKKNLKFIDGILRTVKIQV